MNYKKIENCDDLPRKIREKIIKSSFWVTHIEFVPTQVNMLKRATDLAPTNVGGTAAVLSFAALAGAPVVFTSTVLPLEGAVPTGYRQSKGAAEILCAEVPS